ncbi:MAG: NYN domain-containing protein [Nanoarchaeota archaeon]
MLDKKKNVALFIDNDNLLINLHGMRIDLNVIVDRIKQDNGVIVMGKSYITLNNEDNIDRKGNLFYEHFKRGIEPVFTPKYNAGNENEKSKSLGDPMLFCDAMEILYEKPEIDTFVIVSGDKDMIPLIRHIAKKGKNVIVIGVDESTADALIKECNRLGFDFENYGALVLQSKKDSENEGKNNELMNEKKV